MLNTTAKYHNDGSPHSSKKDCYQKDDRYLVPVKMQRRKVHTVERTEISTAIMEHRGYLGDGKQLKLHTVPLQTHSQRKGCRCATLASDGTSLFTTVKVWEQGPPTDEWTKTKTKMGSMVDLRELESQTVIPKGPKGWGSLSRGQKSERLWCHLHSVGTTANNRVHFKPRKDLKSVHCGNYVCLQTDEFNRIQTLYIYL